MAELRQTEVDLEGLLRVLGQNLYSTPFVAIRELVQNAHDSVVRRRLDDPAFDGGGIRLRAEQGRGVLTVEDDGSGMTADEVVGFLATIGAGATREVREHTDSDELIGMFGVGFLAAFVIAERVSVHTTSWREPERGWRYTSSGGRRYTVEEAEPRPPGSLVRLELRADARPLSDPAALRHVASRYCAVLRVPVFVGDDEEAVNAEPPPWRAAASGLEEHPVQARRRRLDFARRFERDFEPLCTIDVEPTADSDGRGLLWVQSGATYGTSDNRNVSLFVRGMLLSDDARDLLPRWAGFMGAAVESPSLVPTASREDAQKDEGWEALARSVAEQLVEGLASVSRTQPEAWRRVVLRHNEALLGAALVDPRLFEVLADSLHVPTSDGDLRVRELIARGDGRIHVTTAERGGFEEMVFRALNVPIATGIRYGVLPFLRRYGNERGVTVVELGTERGDRHVFAAAFAPPDDVAFLRRHLADEREDVVPVRFAPKTMPLVVVPDREVALKERIEADEADARIASAALALARAHTAEIDGSVAARVYVNLDNPAVHRLLGDPARDERAVVLSLLRSLKGLLGAGVNTSLDHALSQFTDALLATIEEGA